MMAFSKEAELNKAEAALKEAKRAYEALQEERKAELHAITDPLGYIIERYIAEGASNGKRVAVRLLEDSEKIVALLAPDLVELVRRTARDLPGSPLQNAAAAMLHKYGGDK